MAFTASEINTIYQRVLQRDATAEEQAQGVSFSASFGNEATLDAIIALPETNNYVDPIIRLYQAAFGRVPDQAGLNVNVDVLAHNPGSTHPGPVDIISMARAFVVSQEFANLYNGGTLISDPDARPGPLMIQAFYLNVLERQGSSDEIQAWIDTGASIAAILVGFSESSEIKIAVNSDISAFLEAAALGTQDYVGLLEDEDPTDGGSGGAGIARTFTATVGESLKGTTGNDIFSGVVNDAAGTTTLHPTDEAQGFGGSDTLTVIVIDDSDHSVDLHAFEIETLTVTDQDATTFDLAGMASIDTIVSSVSKTASTFENVADLVDVGATSLQAGAQINVVVENSVAAGSVALAVENSAAFALGYETEAGDDVVSAYTINVTGANGGLSIGNTSLVTGIVLQGTGSLTGLGLGNLDALASLNASSLAGGLTGAGTWTFENDVTVTGSNGDDIFNIDPSGNALTANLGDGDDQLELSEVNANTYVNGGYSGKDRLVVGGKSVGDIPNASIVDFEVLEITSRLALDQTISVFDFSLNLEEIVISADLGAPSGTGGDLTLENFQDLTILVEASQTGNVILWGGNIVDITFNPITANDDFAFNLIGGFANAVNFLSNGGAENDLVLTVNDLAQTVAVSAEGDVSLSFTDASNLETLALANVAGKLTVVLSDNTINGLDIGVGNFEAGSSIALEASKSTQDEIVFGDFNADTDIDIANFEAGATGDLLDLTVFGLDEDTDIQIVDGGTSTTLTFQNAAGDDMVITLVGVTGVMSDDIKQFNIES